MEPNTWGWCGLFIILFVSTFGVFWFLVILCGSVVFLIGLFTFLYLKQGDTDKYYQQNPLTIEEQPEGGLKLVVRQLVNPIAVQKTDHRVTGSELIDSSLKEILIYIIRDYISPWYGLITRDTSFTENAVKKTAQTFAVNISNRVKEIDWIPYLTTRLVDEAASHLRLYKQARAKIKKKIVHKTTKNSPLKNSPRKTSHKRNKSETDINWYHSRNLELKKDSEKRTGNSSFYGTEDDSKNKTLEDHFFDLECQMEQNLICRDTICTDLNIEKEFLSELIEILLYILLPSQDFQCKPLRYILREIFTNGVFLPLFDLLSDADYINQAIIMLCLREPTLPTEIFLSTLRITDNCDELKSTKDLISKEIQLLRSRDSGGESDLSIKQQLSSLMYVLKLVDGRLLKMISSETDSSTSIDYVQLDSIRRINLTLDQILKNNVALSYFMDFISNKKQIDLFFYLNVEGWKVSVEQQLLVLHVNQQKGINENVTAIYDNIRSTALSIFEQYLSEKSEQKVDIKANLVQSLHFKIRNLTEIPSEQWFNEVQQFVYEKMENHPDFLAAFKKSKHYIKLLQELDLLQQNNTEDDVISLNSDENIELNAPDSDKNPSPSPKHNLLIPGQDKNLKHTRSFSDVTMFANEAKNIPILTLKEELEASSSNEPKIDETQLKTGSFVLNVNIIETGIVCEKGKTFGIYAIRVSRQYDTGFLEEWHIYRRYSDFHDLYTKIKEKYQDLSKLTFPGKKTFHNMDRAVLERRMKMLGSYMNEICQAHVLESHPGFRELLMTFLEQGEYDRETGGPISSTINTLVNPLKSGMKSIKNMPEQLINTVDEVVGGISKVFHGKPGRVPEASKVGASIEETDDNIPLRIMLLLMDEVFDLKCRNQWLRRRIVTLLRQIVRTMFGDIVNRKILDYVSFITSPKNVAHYLCLFKQAFWPNGMKSEKKHDRDENTRSRTRVAAKVALLSCLSDELKHIIGSETTRRGLLTVFELFQRPILNRRLLYVLLEGILCTLFPEKEMLKIFCKLHAKSERIRQFKERTKS